MKFYFCCVMLILSCQTNKKSDDVIETSFNPFQNLKFENVYKEDFTNENLRLVQSQNKEEFYVARNIQKSPKIAADSTIELVDRNNHSQLKQIFSGRGIFDFEGFKGENLAVAFRRDAIEEKIITYSLELAILSKDLKIKVEKNFDDIAKETKSKYKCESMNERYSTGGVDVATYNEHVYLLTYQCNFYLLTKLDEKLEVVWSEAVTNKRKDALAFYGGAKLKLNNRGQIFTATTFTKEQIEEYNLDFKRSLKTESNNGHILVTTFDESGKNLVSKNFDFSSFSLIEVDDENLYLVSSSNDKNDDDIKVGKYLNKGFKVVYETKINIMDQDIPYCVKLVSGRYLAICGRTGTQQVATGSIVKPGQAFVLILDEQGRENSRYIFGGNRNDYTNDLLQLQSGEIIITGVINGPITHDGDHDVKQLYSHGFLTMFNP